MSTERKVEKQARKATRKAAKHRRRSAEQARKAEKAARDAVALGQALETITAPKQARSERTLARILEAAETLILERGIEQVSITEIVRAAGSSVGGFYGRFRDKEELLVALSERSQRQFRAKVEGILNLEHWAEADLATIVRRAASELVSHITSRRRLQAAFLHSVAARPERWESGIAFRRRLTDGVAMLLLSRRDEIHHPEPEKAVRFALETVLALMDQRALFGDHQATPPLDEATLVKEIERLVLGYLRVDPSPAEG